LQDTDDKRDLEGCSGTTAANIGYAAVLEAIHQQAQIVIHVSAERGEATLHVLFETDERARFLGEVTLAPAGSPFEKTDLLFQNILFDENTGSHIALGLAYVFSIDAANAVNEEEFVATWA
jgi:aminopeptidase